MDAPNPHVEGEVIGQSRLVRVRTLLEIERNVRRYINDLPFNLDLALDNVRQTQYWVYDADDDVFCPNLFAGFRDLTFGAYAQIDYRTGRAIGYDGTSARTAVERTLGRYRPDAVVSLRFRAWLSETFGEGTLSDDVKERRFVTLSRRNYHAIACNPDKYDAFRACQELREVSWTAEPGKVAVGDRVIIWQTKRSRPNRGVVGIGECIAEPDFIEESELEKLYWIKGRIDGPAFRCKLRLYEASGLPLWLSAHPEILELRVKRAHGGTFFAMTRDEWQAIRKLAGAESREEPPELPSSSQGHQLDPRVRKATELRAMLVAKQNYRQAGWLVLDVSSKMSYDLRCERNGETLCVEVKGTTGKGRTVILTRGEVEFARANHGRCALFVLSGVRIDRINGEPVASGGDVQIWLPWDVESGQLTPTQYDYRIPDST